MSTNITCLQACLHLQGKAYILYVTHNIIPFPVVLENYLAEKEYLDTFLVSVHTVDAIVKAEEGNVFKFLSLLIVNGANPCRIGSALLPTLGKICGRTLHIREALNLLHHFASDKIAALMLFDHRLLEELATTVGRDTTLIVSIIKQSKLYEDFILIHPIVRDCCALLIKKRLLYSDVVSLCGGTILTDWTAHPWLGRWVSFLEFCAYKCPQSHHMLHPFIVNIVKYGIVAMYGNLLDILLDTTSIKLVLDLSKCNMLVCVVQFASLHSHYSSWLRICNHIRRHWPSFCKVEMDTPPLKTVNSSVACPITLHLCTHPCVASDGHTYERDALIKHMLINGMDSPITKQKLSYDIFPSYSNLV
jgi:hypothetical protein